MKQYTPMDCPICGKFYFSALQENNEDLGYFTLLSARLGINENIHQCSICGWLYDSEQHENPEMKNGENEMSLNDYRAWYEKKIAENPDYEYESEHEPDPVPHKCPVCGKYEFEDEASFDICPFCGWEDDPVMEDDPDYAGGANTLSLNDYKKQYEEIISRNPDFTWAKP